MDDTLMYVTNTNRFVIKQNHLHMNVEHLLRQCHTPILRTSRRLGAKGSYLPL